MDKIRVIAFYLPQFHPIKENNEWWGQGFTEWTNVAKARSMFPKHYQPKIPADLGFYDLRIPEVREQQAEFARKAGIEGFCYWHYWFGDGKRLLESPFNEVLESGKPNFPFCLGWANESWYKKLWNKDVRKDELLIEQKYGGIDDYTKHFYSVLKAFRDSRYIKVNGKPLFMIYKPLATPEISIFMKTWNELAHREGLPGIYWVGQCMNNTSHFNDCEEMDFDAINFFDMIAYRKNVSKIFWVLKKIVSVFFGYPVLIPFQKVVRYINVPPKDKRKKPLIPIILSGWDHTPRSGKNGTVMTGYTPQTFKIHISDVLKQLKCEYPSGNVSKGEYLVFLKSWNEWGEGNYMEPDLRYGTQFIELLKKCLEDFISKK